MILVSKYISRLGALAGRYRTSKLALYITRVLNALVN